MRQSLIPESHPIIRLNRRNRTQWESSQVERERLRSVGLSRQRSRSRSPIRSISARRNLSSSKFFFSKTFFFENFRKFLWFLKYFIVFIPKNFYSFLVFNDRGGLGGIASVTPRTPRDTSEPGPSADGAEPSPSAAGSEPGYGTDDGPRMPDSDSEVEIPEVCYVCKKY